MDCADLLQNSSGYCAPSSVLEGRKSYGMQMGEERARMENLCDDAHDTCSFPGSFNISTGKKEPTSVSAVLSLSYAVVAGLAVASSRSLVVAPSPFIVVKDFLPTRRCQRH